jgi:[ribosomal protein S5]-alanine N-acetyltransferase
LREIGFARNNKYSLFLSQPETKMLTPNFNPFPVLTTERLVLRQFTPDDIPSILALRFDEKVAEYLIRPMLHNEEETGAYINKMNAGIANNEFIIWGITLKGIDKVIGSICLWNFEKQHFRGEVGYEMQVQYWGKGIMREALSAIIQYGFNTLHMHTVAAIVSPGNAASIRLLERAGFVKEAHFRENIFHKGKFIDSVVYTLLNKN